MLATMAVPVSADAARTRSCPAGKSAKTIRALKARGTSCATARRIAATVSAIRRDRRRYARAQRCTGAFCVVVEGWRCRPASGAAPREVCTSSRRSVSWLWTGR